MNWKCLLPLKAKAVFVTCSRRLCNRYRKCTTQEQRALPLCLQKQGPSHQDVSEIQQVVWLVPVEEVSYTAETSKIRLTLVQFSGLLCDQGKHHRVKDFTGKFACMWGCFFPQSQGTFPLKKVVIAHERSQR